MKRLKKLSAILYMAIVVVVLLPMLSITTKAGGPWRSETVTVEYGEDAEVGVDTDKLRIPDGYTASTLTYEWYECGDEWTKLDNVNSNKYTVTSVKKSATYELYVYAGEEIIYSSEYIIEVNNNLKLEAVGDTSLLVEYGKTATLQVKGSCDKGDLTYSWEYGKGTGTTYVTEPVTSNCNVYCTVTDMYGNKKQIMYCIGIENGLAATADGSADVKVAPNGSATLKVKASCNEGKDELTYSWVDDAYNSLDGNEASITIDNVTKRQSYTCTVRDKYDNYVRVVFTVSVDNGLSIKAVGNTDLCIKAGDKVTLKVESSCKKGKLKHYWSTYWDDEEMGTEYTYTPTSSGEISCVVVDEYGNRADVTFNIRFDYSGLDKNYVYVLSWNDELGNRLDYIYEKYSEYKNKIKVINLGMSGTDNEYKNTIKEYLSSNPDVTFIICSECSVYSYFSGLDNILDMDKLGVSRYYTQSYPYTRKFATVNGKLKGVTWQATPGTFMYDPDIALKVLGTADPAKIQEMISTTEGFLAVGAKMKAAGYYMTSGAAYKEKDEEYYSGMLANMAQIVNPEYYNGDYGLTDAEKKEAAKLVYGIANNGYDTGSYMWSGEWFDDMNSGKVFGWFTCSWGVPWTHGSNIKKPMSVCQGPVPYYWGGSYLVVKSGSKNDVAADVLKALCCDTDVMTAIATKSYDFVNNADAVNKAIKANKYPVTMKNNQNVWKELDKMAKAIDGGNYTIKSVTGIIKGNDGVYRYVKDGVFQSKKTGLVTVDSKKYYIVKGIWKNKKTGLVTVGSKKYYVSKGIFQSKKTGLVTVGSKKYYVSKGVFQSKKTGIITSGSKKYYVKKGIFQPKTTDLIKSGSKKYYVKKGIVSTTTGIVKIGKKRYYVKKGVFQSKKTGIVKVGKKRYRVVKGVVKR